MALRRLVKRETVDSQLAQSPNSFAVHSMYSTMTLAQDKRGSTPPEEYAKALRMYAQDPSRPDAVSTLSNVCGHIVKPCPKKAFLVRITDEDRVTEDVYVRFPPAGFKWRSDQTREFSLLHKISKRLTPSQAKQLQQSMLKTQFFTTAKKSAVAVRFVGEPVDDQSEPATIDVNINPNVNLLSTPNQPTQIRQSLEPKVDMPFHHFNTSINVFSPRKDPFDVVECTSENLQAARGLQDYIHCQGSPQAFDARFRVKKMTYFTGKDREGKDIEGSDLSFLDDFTKDFPSAYFDTFRLQLPKLTASDFMTDARTELLRSPEKSPGFPYENMTREKAMSIMVELNIFPTIEEARHELHGAKDPSKKVPGMVRTCREVLPLIWGDIESIVEFLVGIKNTYQPVVAMGKLKREAMTYQKALDRPRPYFKFPRANQIVWKLLLQPLTTSLKDQAPNHPASFSAYGVNLSCPKVAGDGVSLVTAKKEVAREVGISVMNYGDDVVRFRKSDKHGKHIQNCATDIGDNDASKNLKMATIAADVAAFPWFNAKAEWKEEERELDEGDHLIDPQRVLYLIRYAYHVTGIMYVTSPGVYKDMNLLQFGKRSAGTLSSGIMGTTERNILDFVVSEAWTYFQCNHGGVKPKYSSENLTRFLVRDFDEELPIPDQNEMIWRHAQQCRLKDRFGNDITMKSQISRSWKEKESSVDFLHHSPMKVEYRGDTYALMTRPAQEIIRGVVIAKPGPLTTTASRIFSLMLDSVGYENLFHALRLCLMQPPYTTLGIVEDNELRAWLAENNLTVDDITEVLEDDKLPSSWGKLVTKFTRGKCLRLRASTPEKARVFKQEAAKIYEPFAPVFKYHDEHLRASTHLAAYIARKTGVDKAVNPEEAVADWALMEEEDDDGEFNPDALFAQDAVPLRNEFNFREFLAQELTVEKEQATGKLADDAVAVYDPSLYDDVVDDFSAPEPKSEKKEESEEKEESPQKETPEKAAEEPTSGHAKAEPLEEAGVFQDPTPEPGPAVAQREWWMEPFAGGYQPRAPEGTEEYPGVIPMEDFDNLFPATAEKSQTRVEMVVRKYESQLPLPELYILVAMMTSVEKPGEALKNLLRAPKTVTVNRMLENIRKDISSKRTTRLTRFVNRTGMTFEMLFPWALSGDLN